MTVHEAFALALQHHGAGQLQDAEPLYRQILAADPNYADAWHLLGVIAQQVGQNEQAVKMIVRAVALNPQGLEYHKNLGIALQGSGRDEEAVAAYRVALAQHPRDAVVHNNLGIALQKLGRLEEAIAACRKAIECQPGLVQAHSNLGNALKAAGQLEAALAAYRQALTLAPDYAEAHHNLGSALFDAGQPDAAISALQNALRGNPAQPVTHNILGEALLARGRSLEAIVAFGHAVRLKADFLSAQLNLTCTLRNQGRCHEAIAAVQAALRLLPNSAGLLINLGNALHDLGRGQEAIAAYHEAIRIAPTSALAHSNLGNSYKALRQHEAAIGAYRKALQLAPEFDEAHNNLACALKDEGSLVEAIESLRQAHRYKPHVAQILSNLIYTMLFVPGYDAAMREECARWNRCYADPIKPLLRPHPNRPDPARRLKIGYVSPDFCDHVVGRNLLPLFKQHDHHQFEIYCYANLVVEDGLTARFREHADYWRTIGGATDEQVVNQIRQDGVDILVDLALHMAHGRLPVFAHKPAPVQVTFAGYPGITGLETIDYRLTDPYLDPRGQADTQHSEKPVRLPDSFWCFDPIERDPPVIPSPALTNGRVTFGCLNNFCKVNEAVLALWARVLLTTADSRLLLLSPSGSHRERTLTMLEKNGIGAARVKFHDPCPRPEYLAAYHNIDIVLDTFPYNGHTTSLDALWMGVPVVSLSAQAAVSRAGLSILSNLGLPEFVASSEDEYVCIAAELAREFPRLAALRATLRSRMESSTLMDAPRFAHHIEEAYRQMWELWCSRNVSRMKGG